ncbi:MAG TPA: hypothetical protein VMU04_07525 [Candidatus Acidoferrum sp.]|nr:hypothetical protein [Candidatus Acidoferrum sp.]
MSPRPLRTTQDFRLETRDGYGIPRSALLLWVGVFAFLFCAEARLHAGPLKFQVQLLWGTSEDHSPDPKHKPVAADVRAKLKDLPLKWNNYFEVNRTDFDVATTAPSRVPLSEKCAIEVKSLGGPKVEVTLFGKGKETLRRTQTLGKGEMLVLGGNAPNSTAWLVVLKRME